MTIREQQPRPLPHSEREGRVNAKTPQEDISQLSPGFSAGPDHKHHWRIAEPNGPKSEGSCKHCGEVKQFNNSLESLDYII